MSIKAEDPESPRKRRRISIVQDDVAAHTGSSSRVSLFNEHEDASAPSSVVQQRTLSDDDKNVSMSVTPRLVGNTVAPFLAKHAPSQYAPLGEPNKPQNSTADNAPSLNTKYCYRHRPDLKCRRQADEPSMDQLQHVRGLSLI